MSDSGRQRDDGAPASAGAPLAPDALLAAVLARCLPHGAPPGSAGPPVVVFDLDGTLFDNRPRTVAILQQLLPRWREEHADDAAALAALTPAATRYNLVETLVAHGIVSPARHEEALAHWQAEFFQDRTQHLDVPLPGAVAFARACHAAGATLVYFTGRDLPNMAVGTFAALRDAGFPIGVPRTELVLKPDPATPDAEFKRDVTPEVCTVGTVIAAFDNEPANCNVFAELAPGALVVWLDTQHAPGAPPLRAGIHVLRDFTGA